MAAAGWSRAGIRNLAVVVCSRQHPRPTPSQGKLTERHTAVGAGIPAAAARHIVVAAAAHRSWRRGAAVPGSTTWRMGRLAVSGVRSDGCTRVQETGPRGE
jgi:hypothetical protein